MYSPSPVPRGRLLNMRVNDEEFARLSLLAEHYGVNVSAVIRMLAKRDAVALGLEAATPAPAPKKTPAPSPPAAAPLVSTKPRKKR
jgi:hypothetical protein